MSAEDKKNVKNTVHQFCQRNGVEDLVPLFDLEGLEKIYQLRKLVEDGQRFAQIVTDPAKREKIKEGLTKGGQGAGSGAAQSGEGGAAQGGQDGQQPRGVRACRDFHTKGSCEYGANCKFSHDLNAAGAEGVVADSYEETITIHADMVKFLLKDSGRAIGAIHRQFHTTNERIKNIAAFEEYVTFAVRGAKENVQAALKAIEHVIGVEGQQRREARYKYASHELDYNLKSIDYLVAGNHKNRGTPLELSPASLLAVAQTFRFIEPQKIRHFVVYAGATDREKNEKLLPLIKSFKAIQAMLFVPHNRVEEMEKRASATKAVFRDVAPTFVHREHGKEERMKQFEEFKTGQGATEEGLYQRLLVTTNDFAKLARKVNIPFANLIVHFNAADKETYAHQMNCTGRRGKTGISLLVASVEFSKELIEGLKKDHELTILDGSAASLNAWNQAVAEVGYDSAKSPLTEKDDYPGENWRDELTKQKEKEAAEGKVKQAPPKPKPKAKKAKPATGPAPFEAKPWGRQ